MLFYRIDYFELPAANKKLIRIAFISISFNK